jgi:hypothetical protein
MAHQEKLKQMEMEQRDREKQMELDHEVREAEKNRRRDVLVAEIRSAGYGAMQDINQNQQSDFMDTMDQMRQSSEFQDTMSLQREKESNRRMENTEKSMLEREKMSLQRELKEKDLQIARENKNQFDQKKTSDQKGSKK